MQQGMKLIVTSSFAEDWLITDHKEESFMFDGAVLGYLNSVKVGLRSNGT